MAELAQLVNTDCIQRFCYRVIGESRRLSERDFKRRSAVGNFPVGKRLNFRIWYNTRDVTQVEIRGPLISFDMVIITNHFLNGGLRLGNSLCHTASNSMCRTDRNSVSLLASHPFFDATQFTCWETMIVLVNENSFFTLFMH